MQTLPAKQPAIMGMPWLARSQHLINASNWTTEMSRYYLVSSVKDSMAKWLECLTFFQVGHLIKSLVVYHLCHFGFPPLCITYSVIKCQLLSYHVYVVWEVKKSFGSVNCRLKLSIHQLSSNGEKQDYPDLSLIGSKP